MSGDSKEQSWSLIEQQIAVNNTKSLCKSICKPSEKGKKLMDSDPQDGKSASDELQHYKMENGGSPMNKDILTYHYLPRLCCIPAISVPCEQLLFSSAGYIVKSCSSLEPSAFVCLHSWLFGDI